MLVSYKNDVSSIYEANPYLFMAYEIENDPLNGSVHYTSDDGTHAIWPANCPDDSWVIGRPTERSIHT